MVNQNSLAYEIKNAFIFHITLWIHIQLSSLPLISSSTRLEINTPKFKGLKNLCEYIGGGLYKYTVGNEKDLKSTSALQSEARKKGFVGAFVVAFRNGNRTPMKEALCTYKMHNNNL